MDSVKWIDNITVSEREQMKLIYAAVYIILGILPESTRFAQRDRGAPELLDTPLSMANFSVTSLETSSIRSDKTNDSSVGPQPEVKSVPFQKRFPPLQKLVYAGRKQVSGMERQKLLSKFRWLARDHSDKMIMRYIRQNGDSIKAVQALMKSLVWHIKVNDSEEELRRGEKYYIETEPDPDYINQFLCGKRTIVGYDRQHRPVNILRARFHHKEAQSREALLRYSALLFEYTFMCMQEGVDGATIIFDMTGFKSSNMDYVVAKFIINNMNTMFPMMVSNFFVHKAPSVFKTIYKVLAPLISADIVKKITFTETVSELLTVVPIDQLPTYLGGYSRHEYRWIAPRDEDDAPMRDTARRDQLRDEKLRLSKKFESLTGQWLQCTDATEAARLERERRPLLARLQQLYWELDPYVRSRTIFDRNGVFGLLRKELADSGIAQPACRAPSPASSRRVLDFSAWSNQSSILSGASAHSPSTTHDSSGTFRKYSPLNFAE